MTRRGQPCGFGRRARRQGRRLAQRLHSPVPVFEESQEPQRLEPGREAETGWPGGPSESDHIGLLVFCIKFYLLLCLFFIVVQLKLSPFSLITLPYPPHPQLPHPVLTPHHCLCPWVRSLTFTVSSMKATGQFYAEK